MKKILVFLIAFTGLLSEVVAQSPESFSYQCVVRDAAGEIIANQPVSFRLNVLSGSATGPVEYSELHTATTNEFGLVSLAVGMGLPETGYFPSINWETATYFFNVEADITGGGTYTNMGTVQLQSVPYALFAKSAGNQFSGNYNDLTNVPALTGDVTGQIDANTVTAIQGMGISGNIPANGQVLKWNNSTQVWEPSDDQLGAAGTTDGVVTSASFTGTGTKTLTLIRSNGLGDITALFTDEVNDADADPANEIQTLTIAGDQLTIAGGNTVTLPAGATYTAGSGVDITTGVISNTSPDQLVTIAGAGATTVSGTYPNFTVTSTDLVNDADADPSNEIQTLTVNGNDLTISNGNSVTLPQNVYTAGSNISVVGNVITNTAPDQSVTITNGTGISVSGTYPDFTIANSQPDQTVTLTGNGATTVSGTYPNYTISSTDNNTTYSAGSGISMTGTTINNTAPDQTVTIAGSGATTVAGTYPNFTVSSTDNNTTYTAGTGLLQSGTQFSADNTTAMWNANLLQGVGVSTTAAINGQVLKFNGTSWAPAADNNTTYTAGTGLALTGTTFSHPAHSGDVTGSTALTVTGLQGRQVTANAPANGQVLKWNTTNSRWELGDDELGAAGTNDGVVTSVGVTGTTTKTITLTRSQSLPDLTATFTDEGSVYTAGSGIGIAGNTITNTSPDQTVSLTGTGATTVSGTYPSFTINSVNTTYSAGTGMTLSGTTFNAQTSNALWNANQLQGRGITTTAPTSGQVLKYDGTNWSPAADNNTTYTAGTGISIAGTTITNSSPDQTVTIAGTGATTVTGTYPNFTVTSTDNNTTYTAGTGLALTGTTFSSTQTLAQTLANGNSAGTYSINMNSQNITGANILGLRSSNAAYIDMRYGHIYDFNSSHGVDGQVLRVHGTSPNTYVTWDNPSTLLTAGNGLSYTGNTLNSVWSVNGTDIYSNNAGEVGIGTNSPVAQLEIKAKNASPNSQPLFEIKNAAGQKVFVVYEDSVRIFIDDDPAKTNRGAFAVSGRNTAKAYTHDYFVVSPDSSRVYTTDATAGFGVKNINGTADESYMQMNPSNYFIGHFAGNITTGLYNSFIGYQAGYSNTLGTKNYFIGYRAGYRNIDGFSNIFVGDSTGYGNTYGDKNIFIGNRAGIANTSGNFNVIIGVNAGNSITQGLSNVIIGNEAGPNVTIPISGVYVGSSAGKGATGSSLFNTMIGEQAGMNSDGGMNTYIGALVGSNCVGSNNTYIGYVLGGDYTESNTVRLGNASIEAFYCKGAYSSTSVNAPNMYVTSAGQIMRSTASVPTGSGAASKVAYWTAAGTMGYNTNFHWNNTNGYLGIGTASPDRPLTIEGYGGNEEMISLKSAGTTKWHINMASSSLDFVETGVAAARLYLAAGGNVGIGTNAPGAKLTVNDGAIRIANSADAKNYEFAYDVTNNYFYLDEYGVGRHLYIRNGGNTGIGRLSAANKFEVEGNASKTTAGSWLANSDKRIKTEIHEISDASSVIMKLRPVLFKYSDEWKKEHPSIEDRFYCNFIAQEFQQVFPDAVKGSGEYLKNDSVEILQIDTYDAQIYTIKAVQELIVKMDALEKENQELKRIASQVNDLAKRCVELEKQVGFVSQK